MDRVLRHSWFRSAGSLSVALAVLIVLLGVGGYLLTSTTIRSDRDAAAWRRAQVEAVQTQEVLGRARAYVAGLADVLAGEPKPGQARFARWTSGTSASVGLDDVLWVQSVPNSERSRYERRLGAPITRLTSSGRFERAPAAGSYLPATFTSRTRPELRPGVDVSSFPALAAAIRSRATIFAVGASRPGSVGHEPGFYLLEAAAFARGPDSRGFLVAFVPQGWFATTLGGDPRRVAISQDGRPIEGDLDSVHATASFDTLGRRWRIDVGREPPSGLQSTLPFLALAWPFAAAVIVFLVGRAITLRRRAQRDVERIFELSLDLLGIVGFDGHYRAVNPAFERTLGYSRQEMVSRPFMDFVHPDDHESSRGAFAAVLRGEAVTDFENRFVCADGSERWLQWSARGVPDQGVMYGIARDVTDRRRIDAQLREAQQTAEARGAELRARVEEQAALRRVATLVARGVSPAEIFSAVAEEVGVLAPTDAVHIYRFEPDGTAVAVATWSKLPEKMPLGTRQPPGGYNLPTMVRSTGRAARIDDTAQTTGGPAAIVRQLGIRSAVGSPIVVEGRLWGVVVAATAQPQPIPADTEQRVGGFTALVATAIANADSRAQLAASRARVVTATTEERRRMVRDLHDGAQQRLVHAVITLQLALGELESSGDNAKALVGEALEQAKHANAELRELVHGILPGVLAIGGLRAAVDALASRSSLPVTVDVCAQRFPSAIEATAYFVASEALTNVVKHADARCAEVAACVEDGALRVQVRDDGVGGADPAQGSGLTGLKDRVEALGGTIEMTSPAGGGTSLVARIPIEGD
jgi:PAS domain S-box-containing protein